MAVKEVESSRDSVFSAFQKLVRKVIAGEEYYARVGKVLAVDEANATAEVEIVGGAILDDVMLQKVSTAEGVLMLPKVGSIVAVDWIDSTTAYIAMWSELESVAVRGSEFGGLVKVEQLVSSLNALEQDVNDLKNLLGSVVAVPQDGGAAILAALAAWTAQSLPESQRADLENETITHGNGN